MSDEQLLPEIDVVTAPYQDVAQDDGQVSPVAVFKRLFNRVTVRFGAYALSFARGESIRRSKDWTGMCLNFVRTCFNIAPLYASAYAAWTHAQHRHVGDRTPPVGVPLFWKGGSHGYGHIALSAGNGLCWSSDVRRTGYVDLVKISSIETAWGQEYLGWSEDLNGVRIYTPTDDGGPRGPWPFNSRDKLGPFNSRHPRYSWHDGSRVGETAALVLWQTEVHARPTGHWDDDTRRRTVAWQKQVGLPVTGYPGKAEWLIGTRR